MPVHAPEVVLVDADDASGLASMLADLLADNLRDFRGRARVAARARGSVVLRAADHDLDVTLSFDRDRVEVRDGAEPGATVVAGPWLAMAGLCSGQLSPLAAWRGGDLVVEPGRNLPAAAAAGFVLSVPASFYEDAEAAGGAEVAASVDRKQAVAVGLVAVGAVAAVVVIARRRRRRRRA